MMTDGVSDDVFNIVEGVTGQKYISFGKVPRGTTSSIETLKLVVQLLQIELQKQTEELYEAETKSGKDRA